MLADPRSLFPSCWFCNFAIKVIKPTSMIYFVLLSSIYCACSVFLVSKRAYSDVSLTRSYPYFWLPKLLSGRTAEGRNQTLVCYHSFYSQATPNSTSNVCLSDTFILLISYCSTAGFYDSIFTHRSDVVETGRQPSHEAFWSGAGDAGVEEDANVFTLHACQWLNMLIGGRKVLNRTELWMRSTRTRRTDYLLMRFLHRV